MSKKVGLALGGGTALAGAHLGVLQALHDHAIPIDSISGTSAGAVVAACYAFGVSVDEMRSKAANLSWRAISKFSFSKHGLSTNEALADILKGMIGDAKIEDAKIPLAITATNIASGEYVVFREGSVLLAVRASTCLPGVFAPVKIGDEFFVDGGLMENVPISTLAPMGADVRIGVNVTKWISHKVPRNFFEVLDRAFAIMLHRSDEPIKNDIAIEPHLEAFSGNDFNKTGELFAQGYRATTLKIPEIRAQLYKPSMLQRFRNWVNDYE